MTDAARIGRQRWLIAAMVAVVVAACGGGSTPGSAPAERALAARANAGPSEQIQAQAGTGEPRAASGVVRPTSRLYIVQLADMPVAGYRGGVSGYKATVPQAGKKLDATNPDVVAYTGYLTSKHAAAMASVGAVNKAYSYVNVFNGFAAELTEAQVAKLATSAGVLSITRDEVRKLDTSSTPDFLGLSGPAGVWESASVKGEGVVIGIVDGGVWPEHPSFDDRTDTNGNGTKDGKLGYQQLPGWNGKCVPGELFNGANCNQKLIGARYYNAGWGGNAGIDEQLPWEFNSPRDYGGHGTHTASTAGGNTSVQATGDAAVFGKTSGIAPRARIAAYKVCWETGEGGSCFTTDSVAAIDQAVADGVDVINFSISGSQTSFRDPVEIAFLFAADAGVFVAASAGNAGPTISTVAHPGPWLTTVAAGTHNRDGKGSVTLGNGATYNGASVAAALAAKPVVNATDVAKSGANLANAALCFGAADGEVTLDPAKVAGKIVVCDRGVSARINKSLAVKEAGGLGMILVNPTANSINADFHFVPTVHLQNTDAAAVKAYAANAGSTASIAQATLVYDAVAPLTAAFSSRGPLRAGNGDVLKPDVIAPGQDILAGVAPPGNHGRSFDLYSGTSMSSPHVAGLAALFKQKHPGWSPMAIKSALMTTAYDVLDGGSPAPNTNPVLIFRQGAGHVQPSKMLDPGVVYDSAFSDWLGFICGAQPGGGCTGVTPIDPSNLNQASIAIGDLAGTQTVTRRLTNVSGKPLTLTASVAGSGYAATVSPSSLTLSPGETKPFTIAFLRTSAGLNAYAGGQLTWTGGGYAVRSPIVVRPVALAAPATVSSGGAPISYTVGFGYNGPFTATPRGLVPSAVTADTVADDPTDGTCSLTSPNARLITVVVPAGITHARFALFDADVNPGTDIDLCVFNAAQTLVGSSGSGTSAEEVNLLEPASGTYTVVVQGWGVAGSSPFKLHTWLLGSADAGNMTVSAPASATTGGSGSITLGFSGLIAGLKYLGSVAYGGTTGMPNPTIVRVDP
jgi:subtilisin family serine protease